MAKPSGPCCGRLPCLLLASGFLRDKSYPMSWCRPIPLSIHQSIHSRRGCCLPMKSKVGYLVKSPSSPFPCRPLPRNPLAALDATCFQCALSCYWLHRAFSTWAIGKENINTNPPFMSCISLLTLFSKPSIFSMALCDKYSSCKLCNSSSPSNLVIRLLWILRICKLRNGLKFYKLRLTLLSLISFLL